MISGHKNGKVVYWENTEYKGYLDNYKEEIVSIVSYDKGIVIATGCSYLHFWDLKLEKNLKNLDINSLQLKLNSVDIISLEISGDKLMIVTRGGDVIQIALEQKREQKKNSLSYKFISKRSNNIFQLQEG